MSKEKMNDAFTQKDNHFGFVPKMPKNFFEKIRSDINDVIEKVLQRETKLDSVIQLVNSSVEDCLAKQTQLTNKIEQITN